MWRQYKEVDMVNKHLKLFPYPFLFLPRSIKNFVYYLFSAWGNFFNKFFINQFPIPSSSKTITKI